MATAKSESAGNPRLEPRHSIAVVSRRTGVSQLLLRAWERRYGAVEPGRTKTGRRLYSDRDLEKLTLLNLLTGVGHRIGDIATLPLDELRGLAEENAAVNAAPAEPVATEAPAGQLLDEALKAVVAMDARGLRAALDRALVYLSKPKLRKEFIEPLLVEIGSRWCDGRLRVAHEHMATAVIVSFLNGINSRHRVAAGAPVVAIAAPGGSRHELGGLLATSQVFEAGWDVLYLGSDVPAEDLAAAAAARQVRAILLSITFPAADPATEAQLRELRSLVGPSLPIIVGGMSAASYREPLDEIGAHLVGPDDGLAEILSTI